MGNKYGFLFLVFQIIVGLTFSLQLQLSNRSPSFLFWTCQWCHFCPPLGKNCSIVLLTILHQNHKFKFGITHLDEHPKWSKIQGVLNSKVYILRLVIITPRIDSFVSRPGRTARRVRSGPHLWCFFLGFFFSFFFLVSTTTML